MLRSDVKFSSTSSIKRRIYNQSNNVGVQELSDLAYNKTKDSLKIKKKSYY